MKALWAIVFLVALVGALAWRLGSGSEAGGVVAGSDVAAAEETEAPEAEVVLPAGAELGERAAIAGAEAPRAAQPAPDVAAGPQHATVVVRVVAKDDGRGISGVRILGTSPETLSYTHIDGDRAGPGESPLTNDDGVATLTVPAGVGVSVHAAHTEGTGSATSQVAPLAPGSEHEVTLRVATGIARYLGRVVTVAGGEPIPDAEIRVDAGLGWTSPPPEWDFASDTPPDTVTDARGEFELTFAPWMTVHVGVTAEGYGPALLQLTESHDTLETRQEVRLPEAARLVGRVVGVPAGETGATVELATDGFAIAQPEGTFLMAAPFWSSAVAADGTFAIAGLPPNVPLEATIRIGSEDVLREPAPIVLEPGAEHDVEWRLGAGSEIHGLALAEDNRPESDLTVWLLPAPDARGVYLAPYDEPTQIASTDENGLFRFADVPAGEWAVGPAPYDRGGRPPGQHQGDPELAPAVQRVTVDPDVPVQEVVLRLYRGHFVEGTVLDVDGGSAVQCNVRANGLEGGGWSYANTESDGSFRLGPLVPGRYSLTAQAYGRGTSAPSEAVEVGAGDSGVRLQLTLGGMLSGVVVDAGTGEPTAAKLAITAPESFRSTSTRDGTFAIGGLEARTYDLVASTEDGRIGVLRDLDLAPGATLADLQVAVEVGGRVRVGYTGTVEWVTYRILVDGARVASDGLQDGTDSVRVVPPGEAVVQLVAYDRESAERPIPVLFEREQTVSVQSGEEVGAIFDVED